MFWGDDCFTSTLPHKNKYQKPLNETDKNYLTISKALCLIAHQPFSQGLGRSPARVSMELNTHMQKALQWKLLLVQDNTKIIILFAAAAAASGALQKKNGTL